MAAPDLGDFTGDIRSKPQPGVSIGEIPENLGRLLAEKALEVMGSTDHELVLTAQDEEKAKLLALYARAWGAQQTPKLYIKKLPNGKLYSDNIARLSVEKWDDVPTENRPGRRHGK